LPPTEYTTWFYIIIDKGISIKQKKNQKKGEEEKGVIVREQVVRGQIPILFLLLRLRLR
jgi:hypothetical protein